MNILVIDNDDDFRQMMHDVLAERGWHVTSCADTLSAYASLAAVPPDLVVLDLRMETLDAGWDVLTYIQLHPRFCEIPIVLCTAGVHEIEHRREWLRHHDIDVLAKPFDIDVLYSTLDRHLAANVARVDGSSS